jgi:VIT1/CCC1 family predicted Fe2+/Mn2+ transporter
MKWARRFGFNFGLTSGVITTLGLMVGLHSSTQSKIVVIGGVLTIAVADALSDSMGIHLAVESQNVSNSNHIWEAMFSTFLFKFIFSSLFVVPVLLLPLRKAVIISIFMGLYLIFANSLYLARQQNVPAKKVIIEHLILTIIVIVISHLIGCGISHFFPA